MPRRIRAPSDAADDLLEALGSVESMLDLNNRLPPEYRADHQKLGLRALDALRRSLHVIDPPSRRQSEE